MSLDNIKQEYFIFEFKYYLVTEGKTRIFGSSFVNKNKDNCIMIHNGKEHKLIEYYEDINNDYRYYESVTIQLKIDKNIQDISNICYKCKTLLSIKDISELDNSFILNLNESFSRLNSNSSIKSLKSESFYDDNSSLSQILSITKSNSTINFTDINGVLKKIYFLIKFLLMLLV